MLEAGQRHRVIAAGWSHQLAKESSSAAVRRIRVTVSGAEVASGDGGARVYSAARIGRGRPAVSRRQPGGL